MSTDDTTRSHLLHLTLEVAAGTRPVDADVAAELAAGLLAIAELAMPDTYFRTDSRCGLARAVLAATGDPRAEEHP